MPEVKFRGFGLPDKLGMIKAVREALGLGLREAVDLIAGLNLSQTIWIKFDQDAERFMAQAVACGYKFEYSGNPNPDITVTFQRDEYDALAMFMFPHLVELFKEHYEAAKRSDRDKMRSTYALRTALNKLRMDPMNLVMPTPAVEPPKDE